MPTSSNFSGDFFLHFCALSNEKTSKYNFVNKFHKNEEVDYLLQKRGEKFVLKYLKDLHSELIKENVLFSGKNLRMQLKCSTLLGPGEI